MTRTTERISEHVSALELDLNELGALDEATAKTVSDHIQRCERCREEQATLRRRYKSFARDVFPRTAPLSSERIARETSAWYARPSVWVPVAVAALAVIVLAVGLDSRTEDGVGETAVLLAKGGRSTFTLIARRGGEVFTVGQSAELQAGDELGFVVTSSAPLSHLLVVSIDASGRANRYFPFGGARSAAIAQPGRWEVPGSIRLDATPGPERIFALFSAAPLDAVGVEARLLAIGKRGSDAIRASERLDLPDVEQSSLLIEKRVP